MRCSGNCRWNRTHRSYRDLQDHFRSVSGSLRKSRWDWDKKRIPYHYRRGNCYSIMICFLVLILSFLICLKWFFSNRLTEEPSTPNTLPMTALDTKAGWSGAVTWRWYFRMTIWITYSLVINFRICFIGLDKIFYYDLSNLIKY